jgi:hypothetical protein
MVTASALSGLIHQVPGWGGFALAALALVLSPVAVIWVSFHRRAVLLARVEKERFQAQCEREVRIFEIERLHTERMYELDTVRTIALREQERLDRLFEAELSFVEQLTARMKAEAGREVSPLPAVEGSSSSAQVGRRAA